MKKISTLLCFGAVLSAASPSFASTSNTTDLVAASFARILDEPTTLPATISLTQLEDDPLHRQLAAQLWQLQPTHCAFMSH